MTIKLLHLPVSSAAAQKIVLKGNLVATANQRWAKPQVGASGCVLRSAAGSWSLAALLCMITEF